jgi:hypothetical protein
MEKGDFVAFRVNSWTDIVVVAKGTIHESTKAFAGFPQPR